MALTEALRRGAIVVWSHRLPLWVTLAGLAVFVCLTSAATADRTRVSIKVRPGSSVEDHPVRIRVRGLAAHERVTVRVRSVDAKRVPWVSSTLFRADSRGRLDLSRAVAIGGSYERGAGYPAVWGMGVVAMMRPTRPAAADGYSWGGERRFTVSVRAHGETLASTVFHRTFSARRLRMQHTTLSGEGFVGDFFSPSSLSGKRPALLTFGGSEGAESTYFLSALLAAHGYPTLALAYFKEPGLPQTLSNIPLEYFAKALRWLRQQPHVDPNRILTFGGSRGSEAALLLGVHYPSLVHGVIAMVPANVALCSYPGCSGPTWTLGGQPLPYTRQFNQPHPTDNPSAVIPVEQIPGPIFLYCAGRDQVWNSCAYAKAITQRLNAHHDRYRHLLLRSPNAGHSSGLPIPYEPQAAKTSVDDEQARERVWPQLLNFLAHT